MVLVAPREVVRDLPQRLALHLRLRHYWSQERPQRLAFHLQRLRHWSRDRRQRLALHLWLRHYWSQERLQRLATHFRLCPRPWTGCREFDPRAFSD